MAGGPLSPRQKMINMMYLVLTAMLALNVSAEILRSFELISDSLEQSALKYDKKNSDLGLAIIEQVKTEMEQGNNNNEYLIEKVEELEAKTDEVLSYIDARIEDMFTDQYGGGRLEGTDKLKKADELEKNYRYWMIGEGGRDTDNEGRGSGHAMELRDELNGYVDWCNSFLEEMADTSAPHVDYPPIAVDPKDDPTNTDPEQESYSWEYTIFHGAPVAANVAMLNKFKNDVSVLEAQVMDELANKLQEVPIKIDSLIGQFSAESRYVIAGTPFRADLFVTTSSSQAKPQFIANTGSIVSSNENVGKIQVMASGNFAGRQQSWSATIRVPWKGKTKDLPVSGTFNVVRPEIQVTSETVQNLYRNCGNVLNVDVPALTRENLYNPVIALEGGGSAQVSESSNTQVLVVPTGRAAKLKVSSRTGGQTIYIGEVTFPVVEPPKPNLALYTTSGQLIPPGRPIPRGATLVLRAEPDPDFARLLPRDARYQMRSVHVKSAPSPLVAPTDIQPAANSGASGPGRAAQMQIRVSRNLREGAQLIIEVESMVRINFLNRAVPVQMSTQQLSLSYFVR